MLLTRWGLLDTIIVCNLCGQIVDESNMRRHIKWAHLGRLTNASKE